MIFWGVREREVGARYLLIQQVSSQTCYEKPQIVAKGTPLKQQLAPNDRCER